MNDEQFKELIFALKLIATTISILSGFVLAGVILAMFVAGG